MISQILRNAETQSQREAELEKSRRRYRFLYFVVSLVVAILALVLFTVTEQHAILIAAMTAIFGFAGGLGVGKVKGRR